MTQGNITCTGKDGVTRIFYYNYSEPLLMNKDYRLTIFASSDYSDVDFFELTAHPKNASELKIISINKNNDALYGAKGIPDSAIPELILLSNMGVCSSSQQFPTENGEYRTDHATKFWERLKNNGKATYDQSTDVYTYT